MKFFIRSGPYVAEPKSYRCSSLDMDKGDLVPRGFEPQNELGDQKTWCWIRLGLVYKER